jgi:hypothetical protein
MQYMNTSLQKTAEQGIIVGNVLEEQGEKNRDETAEAKRAARWRHRQDKPKVTPAVQESVDKLRNVMDKAAVDADAIPKREPYVLAPEPVPVLAQFERVPQSIIDAYTKDGHKDTLNFAEDVLEEDTVPKETEEPISFLGVSTLSEVPPLKESVPENKVGMICPEMRKVQSRSALNMSTKPSRADLTIPGPVQIKLQSAIPGSSILPDGKKQPTAQLPPMPKNVDQLAKSFAENLTAEKMLPNKPGLYNVKPDGSWEKILSRRAKKNQKQLEKPAVVSASGPSSTTS